MPLFHFDLSLINTSTPTPNVLFLTSKFFEKHPLIDLICKQLCACNVSVISEISPNPTLELIHQLITTSLQSAAPDVIISIGGGSVLDTAKILSVFTSTGRLTSVSDLQLIPKKPRLIVIPTTAGTGSEVTPFSTLWDHKDNSKLSISHSLMQPDEVLYLPDLLQSLSFEGLLYPALDTLSHALDSFWNRNTTPKLRAESILCLLSSLDFLRILATGSKPNTTQLLRAQLNSTQAGFLISKTKTSILHSISYPLTLRFNMPHGLACAFSLSAVVKHYLSDLSRLCPTHLFSELLDVVSSLQLSRFFSEYPICPNIDTLASEILVSDRASNFAFSLPEPRSLLHESLESYAQEAN